jgi:PKD repeat protein
MKRDKTVIGIITIIIIIIVILIFEFYSPSLFESSSDSPDARIEINRSEQQGFIIHQGEEIFFSAKNSSDADGEIDQYNWNFGDGTTSKSMNSKHTYDEPGTYNVTLTVVDDDGNKDIKYMEITINSLPVAVAQVATFTGEEPIIVPIAKRIQFNGSASYDSDGRVESYYWDFGDGNQSSLESPEHYYFTLGIFKVTLIVVDDVGGFAEDNLDVEIIMRTYVSEWTLNEQDIVIDDNGYTLEGQSTERVNEIIQDKIAKIYVNLTWEDRQPFLRDNETQGEDHFELHFVTPENLTMDKNSTTGNISILVPYNSEPASKQYKAKTKSDAISLALDDAALSEDGDGEWYFNVTAIECKGGNWINEEFDLDVGNSWSLRLKILYFELEVREVTEE